MLVKQYILHNNSISYLNVHIIKNIKNEILLETDLLLKNFLKRHLDYYHSIGRQYVKNCNKHICMLYPEILYNFKYWIIFVDFFHK